MTTKIVTRKTVSSFIQKSGLLCAGVFFALMAQQAFAGNQWWDNNGLTAPTGGTWDTTTHSWTGTTSNLTASTVLFTNGNTPVFVGGPITTNASMTITVNSAVTCAGMYDGITGGAYVTALTFAGSGSINIASGLPGFFCQPGNLIFNVPVTGAGGITQNGSGSIALVTNNSYAGGTSLTGGQIIYYYTNSSFGTGPINVGGTGNALVNSNTAALTITNNFTFPTAGYNINLAGGNPVAGAPGTTFTGNFPLPATGTITLNTSSSAAQVIEISGVISGASGLTVADDGTLELAGTNTYTGGTTISSPATLNIIGSGCLGVSVGATNYAGGFTNNSTFNYSSSANQILSGGIAGAGPIIQNGPGTLTLSGVSSYTGTVTVSNGTLNFSGSMPGSVTVANTGIASVTGSVGSATVNAGALTNAGTITGNVIVNGGSVDVGTGVANSASGLVSGNITANGGTVELDSATALSSFSVLNLPASPSASMVNLNFSGTQTIAALNFGATSLAVGTWGAVGSGAANTSTAFTGSGILSVTASSASIAYWDPGALVSGVGSGGNGTWDNSTLDWWVSGSLDTNWPAGTVAEFAGTAGTVTVAANVTADSLTFVTPGYTIAGSSTVTLVGPLSTITIPAGGTAISAPIAGAGATNVAVSGPGTLTLSGASTYTAITELTNGATVSVNNIGDSGSSALGLNGSVLFGGGSTLIYTGSGSNGTSRNVTANGAGTSTINVPSGVLALNGAVKGGVGSPAQVYTKTGAGTLYLGGSANDNGSATMAINQGEVIISKASTSTAHGLGGGTSTVASGAELQLAGSGSYDLYSGCLVTVAPGGLFDVNGQNDSFSTLTISGNGFGNGVLINSASGTTSLLTNAGGAVVLAGPTTIGGAGGISLFSVVSGDYPLTYIGTPGTLTLAAANTFNGGLYINPNCTAQINIATGAGTGPTVLGSGSTFGVNIAAGTLANPVVGPANSIVNIIETAADNLTISSDMSGFTGTMNCPPTAGTTAKAQITSTAFSISPSATINVASGGTLFVTGNGVVIPCNVIFHGTGNTEPYGALRLSVSATISGPVILAGTVNTTMGNDSGVSRISGAISGTNGITFTAEGGTIILSGANTYTGATTLTAPGMVQLGSPELGTSGPLGEPSPAASSLLCKGGTLKFTPVNTFDYSGRFSSSSTGYVFDEQGQTVTLATPLAGAATFTNISSIAGGVLVLSAANTYSGITAINSGTVQLAGPDNAGTSGPLGANNAAASIILSGGTLQYTAANGAHDYSTRFSTAAGQGYNIDVNGQPVIFAKALTSGTGQITLSSSTSGGSLSLSGTNAYTGATTINAGATLTISGAGCLGATNTYTNYAGLITDQGTFNYASSTNQILSGVIFGGGSLVQSGTGILTLSNVDQYFGGTTVSAGTLRINATGSIVGNVTVTGGVLELDNANALNQGAVLTLAGSPAAGTVNLNFSGTQYVDALAYGSTAMPAGTYGASASNPNGAFIGTGLLVVNGEGTYWDPGLSGAGTGSGGAGSWDGTTGDWLTAGADTTWSSGNFANFAGTAGTVTVNANQSVDGLTFATPGYTVTGGSTLTLSGTAGSAPTITVPAGNTTIAATVASAVATNPVIFTGPGTLTLSGQNTFTNNAVITGGTTVSVNSIADSGSPSALGTGTTLTMLGGSTLSYTGSSAATTTRTNTLSGATTSYINVPVGDSLEWDGQIHAVSDTAPQVLTFTGGGTLILGGTLDNSGLDMAINAGTVVINKNSTSTAHGLGGGTSIVASNATLQLSGNGNADLYTGCVLTVNNGGVFDLNGQSDNMSTLTLSGNGTGSGALINSGGSSSLTNTGSFIVLAGNTTIGGGGNITLYTNITGIGTSLTYTGQGTLFLSGSSTFSGGLNVSPNSTVQLNTVGAGGTGTINVGLGGTLTIANALNVANNITGTNSGPNNPTSTIVLSSTGTGNWTLTAGLAGFGGTIDVQDNNPASGGLGTQLLINNILNEAYPINAAATWKIENGVTVDMVTPFTNDPASVQIYGIGQNGYGALRLDCCNQQGNVTLEGPNCQIGSGFNSVPKGVNMISGIISDGGNGYGFTWMSLANPGPTLVLTAVNTYTGPTVVSNVTTLALSGSGSIATSSGICLASGATFDVTGVSGSYAIGANQTFANLSGSATINGNLTFSSGVALSLTNSTNAAPLVANGGTVTMNNNPLNVVIGNTVVPTANGYLLIAGTNGGSVAGSVSSSQVTINGQLSNPGAGGPSLSIIGGSLYLVAGPPDIMVGVTPANPVIFASATNSITFNAIVFGAQPLTNQWYTNGSPVPGASNTSVTLSNVGVGTYTVTFGSTNAVSPSASSSTTLTVLALPTSTFAEAVLSNNPVGYWRLNEPDDGLNDNNNGQICHDYIKGNDGIYTNTTLGNLGYDSIDAALPGYDSETSAGFAVNTTINSCAYNIPNIDVSLPTNKSATFTVQAWVQCSGEMTTAINTPGVVGKGLYNNEEFTIDCGTHIGTVDAYRFSVRNAGATVYNAGSALIAGSDTNWHFLVGVCDEVHSNVSLYIDGTNAASVLIPANSGIAAANASVPMFIGARSSTGASFDQQFNGFVNDVAIFTNAFTAAQIQNEYFQAGIAPTVTVPSNNITINEFGTVLISSFPYGTPNLAVQWYLTDNNNNVTALSGQTNAILDLTNVQSSYQNVYVVVTNTFGSVTSSAVSINVNSGAASIDIDASPSIIYVPAGTMLTYSVVAYGANPIYYEWLLNSTNVILGATNSTYSFLAQIGTNTYTCGVSNSQNSSWSLGNPVTVVAANTPPVVGFSNPSLWSIQHSGAFTPILSGGILEITSAAGSEAGSAFYEIPQYISNGFVASFIYTPSGGTATRADGATFVVENSANTYQAIGAGGGDLGVTGISPCVNFDMDIYSSASGGTGINWGTNGATAAAGGGAPNGGTSPVNINSLDPILVTLTYASSSNNVQVVLKDTTTSGTYTTNYKTGNLATMLGSVDAYVGFTGGTGGSDAEQQISAFTFVYTAPNEGPAILNDISPTNLDAPVGADITYTVGAIGTTPLYYQWFENGSAIPGATASTYTFAATAGNNNYQVAVTNSVSGNTNVYSSLASVTAAVTPPAVGGFGNASLWQWQGTVADLSGGVLTLTTAAANEVGSGYYTIPQYINNGFVASFTYTPSAGTATRADGATFTLQNTSAGPFSIGNGGGGGGLGVYGTSPCINFNMDIYSNAAGGTGISLGTNGTTAVDGGSPNGGTGAVNINSLDPINFTLTYHPELGKLQVTLVDSVANTSYSTNYTVGGNLASLVGGNSAYVGFTAGTGADDAGQQFSNFSFSYTGPAAAIIQDIAPLFASNTVGSTVNYSVVASGDQPISYAWFVNSNLVAGAINPTYALVIPAVGSNTVQVGVSNAYNGTYALSSVAIAVGTTPAAPTISIQQEGTNVVISWSAGADLFSTPDLTIPWTMVTNATSPYTTNSSSASQQFYKAGTPY